MSYDPKNLFNRFLRLNRLNSSINYGPAVIHPFNIYPPGLYQSDRDRFPLENMINKIQDVPNTSDMGTELLKDLLIRQEEFLKRIRKHPSNPNPDDAKFMM